MSWILTYTGRHFDLLDPQPDMVHADDIAHALANIARFNGHTRRFYSVAQHSVFVSTLVPEEFTVAALLHDAAEAYFSDVVRPIKPHLTNYAEIEERIENAIYEHFGLFPRIFEADEIKQADLVALATERRDLMPNDPTPWPALTGIDPAPMHITPLQPREAEELFERRWDQLGYWGSM